ncbi:lipoprotein [Spiroplasma endosymbiont of Atherix ibis]
MKKILSVLATVGVVASSTTTVIACGTKKEDKNFKPE